MNPKYDSFEVAQPKSRSVPGYVIFLGAILLTCVAFGLIGHFRNSNTEIEIRTAVTIFMPQRIGIDPDACSAHSFTLELSSYGKKLESIRLGDGESVGTKGDEACRFTFLATVPKEESYELSAPDDKLPTRRLDRISDRLFSDGDTEYVLWEIWWEP